MDVRLPTYSDSIDNSISDNWRKRNYNVDSFPESAPNPYAFTSHSDLFRDINYRHYSTEIVPESDVHDDSSGTVFSFKNLFYKIKIRKKGCPIKWTDKVLLNGVSGMFKQGMNAIMGPTGCGKTTLLDILAGRKDKSGLKGEILVDGSKQPNNFNMMAGYVQQDDQIMGTLTVKENLMFSANLRLPSTVSKKEKKEMVETIISELGLVKCSDTKVGTEFIRGVSGGERKRTCIGMELLVSRGILFLDEPTTGLDAFTANSVMSLLQRLSTSGITIIFSIHQPRYNIFKLFDTLMLLGSGHVIYHGKASLTLDFFQEQNFKCEAHNNPPDFFLDIINGDISSHYSVSSSTLSTISVISGGLPQWDVNNVEYTNQVRLYNGIIEPLGYSFEDLKNGSIVPALSRRFKESQFYESWNKKIEDTLKVVKHSNENRSYASSHSTSFVTQLFYVSKRTSFNVIRDPTALVVQGCLMLLFSLIIGGLYLNITNDGLYAIQDRAGSFFLIILVLLFANLSAIELFIKERSLFLREYRSGYYRVSAYFVSKLFCDLIPLRIFPVTLFCVITYFMMGLRKTAENFFLYLLTLFLTTLCSAMMTFFISASIRTFAIANVVTGFVILIMAIFGGLLLNVTSIPIGIRWLQYVSIIRYSFKALLINELKDAEFASNATYPSNVTYANQYLSHQGISFETSWDYWQNNMALGVGTLIFTVLCYSLLLILAWKK